ncbi:unnamed protein product [Amoebophrya sp. A25]|nr:unnamed protein product [Amoebophrya sp. A25]|eukprot:GSA25T00005204001.1
MEGFGVMQHEQIGADFYDSLGLPRRVSYLVANHVNAKRFLVSQDAAYHDMLTEASKTTLRHQGGPMSAEEAEAWAANHWHKDSIALRKCDEAAKEPDLPVPTLDDYRPLFIR